MSCCSICVIICFIFIKIAANLVSNLVLILFYLSLVYVHKLYKLVNLSYDISALIINAGLQSISNSYSINNALYDKR